MQLPLILHAQAKCNPLSSQRTHVDAFLLPFVNLFVYIKSLYQVRKLANFSYHRNILTYLEKKSSKFTHIYIQSPNWSTPHHDCPSAATLENWSRHHLLQCCSTHSPAVTWHMIHSRVTWCDIMCHKIYSCVPHSPAFHTCLGPDAACDLIQWFSICEHQWQRNTCKDCGGNGLCEHQRVRTRCKDCGGSGICEHQRQRSTCKDWGGSGICEHQWVGSKCKDCGGCKVKDKTAEKENGKKG